MIKPAFGIKNIFVFIISCALLSIHLLYICSFFILLIRGEMNIFASILMMLICIMFGLYTWEKMISQVIPKKFHCMKAVTQYITFRDLKELLRYEEFIPFDFPEDIVTYLRINKVKSNQYDIRISQNWVCAKGVYIPKKMIVGTCERVGVYNRLDENSFHLINGDDIPFGFFHHCCGIVTSYFNRGIEIPTIKTIKNKKTYCKEKFVSTVKGKDSFIVFLEDDGFYKKTKQNVLIEKSEEDEDLLQKKKKEQT